MSEDFYSLLGVNQNSSTAEIKKSYKQLARKYHPDNSSTGNEEMFKKIGEAYAVLSDSQKKSVYDQVGHEAFVNGGSRAGAGGFGGGSFFSDFGDMDDIMSTFFGGSFGGGRSSQRNRRQRGGDVQVTTDLTFMEAVKGKTQEIKFNRLTECKTCDGSGADPAVGVKTCETCNGMGEVKRTTQSFLGMVTQISTCPTCNGKGNVIKSPCKDCSGKGQNKEAVELEVKIPKGAEHGSRLVWQGKGHAGKNKGPNGDLYILLNVKPHKHLKRKGLDIFEEKEIDVWDAILGTEIEAETVNGNEKVEIKSGTQPDTLITLHSMGVKLENTKTGNHFLKIKVKVPSKKELPSEFLEALEASKGKDNSKNPSIVSGLLGKIRGKDKK